MTLRQAMRVVAFEPADTREEWADRTLGMLRRWRREHPEQFAELRTAMRYPPERRPGVVVQPDEFRREPPQQLTWSRSTLREIEIEAIRDALDRHHGVQAYAARELGISPRVMNYKLQTLGLQTRRGASRSDDVAADEGDEAADGVGE